MNDTQIKPAGGAMALWITPATFELLRQAARGTLIADEEHFRSERRGNQTFVSLLNPLPPGAPGDVLFFAEEGWVSLPAPAAGSILYHDGTTPVWLEPSGTAPLVLTSDGETPAWSETSECA